VAAVAPVGAAASSSPSSSSSQIYPRARGTCRRREIKWLDGKRTLSIKENLVAEAGKNLDVFNF